MSFLSTVEATLPPGFRFHPRDEELICDYLMTKESNISGRGSYQQSPLLIEVDLNKCEPWDLPEMACVGGKEWYFFSHRDRKYATGLRTNRATVSGYWKATGKDRQVIRKGTLVGMRKTLVFYQGRAPKGRKTDWVMHEFRLEGPSYPSNACSVKEDWVLCRVFYKSRGVSAKPAMENSYDDTVSSSLPPLMDSYITFDQTPTNLEEFEQVPCFSNYPPNQTNPTFSHITQMEPNIPTLEGIPDMANYLNPFHCDKKIIKEVLNHFSKMESNLEIKASPSFGEGNSESYLSELGLPIIWNHY
ncbi:hypothetical protein HHK36_004828 [Tetracentron sinense]|uniref:NAC domain-containing protein n=1 Tax=Tetracentron sinense TaxID=13715 RepID=A0A834ZNF0_TETSI|nr:hypothetical protein HHK36_004828 [Tetracentron sinense]